MLEKRHLTCRLHVLTLLDQQMLYNIARSCSRGLKLLYGLIILSRVTCYPNFIFSASKTKIDLSKEG